ncbi:hypothetical protein CRI70_00575 [Streptomyces sp. Ru87]|uniref:DUF3515 domain-containing protein n=1 Tax=Streptomyces lycii TaxID=2654337 RepID=A0ABQ7FN86_9ACTN|nr:DUF3515 domain-containing protein [Streptomyces lycii]PGH52593.1 hypothetical protein CRI70_00575 [Streptomyces sp. Ru87]
MLLTVTALLAAAGCSLTTGAGTRPVPEPSPEAAKLCRALQKELPGTVDGLERNTGGPPSEFAAEWGDPAVQLRCGVPRPEVLTPGGEHYNPTAEGVEVNGVLWLPEKQEDGYRFTTTLRKAYVEVTVPGTYQPELNALTDLADAVESTIPNEL